MTHDTKARELLANEFERQGETGKADAVREGTHHPVHGIYSPALRAIEAAIASERAAVQWQPIETAPKDGTKVLLYWYANDMPFMTVGWWRGSLFPRAEFPWRSSADDSGLGGFGQSHLPASERTWRQGPTHWMPLPPPPAIEQGERRDG